jgi:rhamnose transport system permease protein
MALKEPHQEVVGQRPPPGGGRAATTGRSRFTTLLSKWEAQLVVLLILAIIVCSFLSPYFLDVRNLFDMTFNFMEKSIMALPMTFIIIAVGSVDLSIASTMAMSAIAMAIAFQAGAPMGLALLTGLAVGTMGGLFNGFLVGKARLPALVATLGTYALYRGLGYSMLGDLTVQGFPDWFNYLGQGYILGTPVPFALVLFLVLALIFGLVLHRTTLGRFLYAMGQNEEACRFSGVAVDRIKVLLFALSGFMAAVAGAVMAARFGSTRADIGLGFELDVITAVVLGGVDIGGGSGSMIGVVLALFLLGLVRFGMSLLNIRGQVQSIVVGLLLILAILLPELIPRLQERPRRA